MDLVHSRRAWWAMVVVLVATAAASAQPRPFLFSMGRYNASWAQRPPSYDIEVWDHMVQIGATMNGAGLAWVDGEPTPGQINMNAVIEADTAVDEILARGMEPNFFVGLTPAWAALHPELPPHRTPPSEDYVEEFMDFHRFVADRYKGRVKYYFFWNEPNGCSWINDGCANMNSYPLYTKWLIRCSQAIKEVDPDAKIIAGRLDYHSGVTHGWQYVQGMYNEGAGPHIDGIAIHPYDWGWTLHWQAITDTRNVMVSQGDGHKPIWITEFGWNLTNYQETANRLVHVLTELKKPEYHFVQMANYLVLNDGPGVENYGLMDANLNPRAGYFAFQNFDKTFPDAVNFSADVTSGAVPLTVQFTDQSTIADPTGRLWEFGDGQTSGAQHPSHTYTQEGSYTVKLTVTSSAGSFSEEKVGYINVSAPSVDIQNPSFEDGGGSLTGWQVTTLAGGGPDNPPRNNVNGFGVVTPFGEHFAGKITNGGAINFYIGQVVAVPAPDPTSVQTSWELDTWVQMHSTHENQPNPTGIHQVWEIGWNDDGSIPTGIMDCDHYTTMAAIDGTFTGNHANDFFPVSADGTIAGVAGLQGVALRVHLFNNATWWWSLINFDNVSLSLTAVPSPVIPGDFDGDDDVDLSDFGHLQACLADTTTPACADADLDASGSVSDIDIELFLQCLSGANVPQVPGCLQTQ